MATAWHLRFLVPSVAVLLALRWCGRSAIAGGLTVAVPDVFAPAPPGSLSIGGRLGEKLDLCVMRRLLPQDVQALIAPYRLKREAG